MAKSKTTLSFRPNEWEERAVQAAERATQLRRSELLRRCVSRALPLVVADILKHHKTAVSDFHDVLREKPEREWGLKKD